jgi:hypothetical protein
MLTLTLVFDMAMLTSIACVQHSTAASETLKEVLEARLLLTVACTTRVALLCLMLGVVHDS